VENNIIIFKLSVDTTELYHSTKNGTFFYYT